MQDQGHGLRAVLGQEVRVAVKQRVGYLPDNPIFYDYLRGREILAFVGDKGSRSLCVPKSFSRQESSQAA